MNRGDIFKTDGYEIVATVYYASGQLLAEMYQREAQSRRAQLTAVTGGRSR